MSPKTQAALEVIADALQAMAEVCFTTDEDGCVSAEYAEEAQEIEDALLHITLTLKRLGG